MPYEEISWSARDPVVDTKLQKMSDNDAYFYDEIENRMPKGILGGAKRVTQIDGLVPGGSTLLTGLSVAITIPADRIIKVTFYTDGWESNQDDTTIRQQIFRDAAIINSRHVFIPVLGTGQGGGSCVAIETGLAAGTYTWQAGEETVIAPTPGSNVVKLIADANNYAFILVEDIGSSLGITITET